jgi:hypothetical protein
LRVFQVVVLRLKGTKKSQKATNHDNCNLKMASFGIFIYINSISRIFRKIREKKISR